MGEIEISMHKLKQKYIAGTKAVVGENAKEANTYMHWMLGKKFIVYPDVFSQKYFTDTEFFAKEIKVTQGEKFLEIGPGTGIISVFAALQGAKRVVAIDINPSAVKNTKINAKLHAVSHRVKVYQGDVYAPLERSDRFDTIFWNTPFGYIKHSNISMLERAVFDPHYKSTKKFVEEAKEHLKKNGRLLIGFSTTLGHFSILKKLLVSANFKIIKLIAETRSFETHPVKFQLYEAKL
ncbi:MAG: methyltransferase small [Parcubacteria group bacterium Gr01-1014_33]|nr:MAG: methyltransferase small [Parcubacteria group bacterium Gr01-1014_33]